MPAAITVLYPNDPDATFDLDYYLAKHMTMVMRLFAPHGMTGWRVARFVGTPGGEPSPSSIVATLEFKAPEGFRAALAEHGGEVLGDVPNFSNKAPVIMIGEVAGHG